MIMLDLGHKKLQVYQVAITMVKEVYKLTKDFPIDERFGLVSQLRRAAVSVCSNIAEGAARKSAADRKRFYEISRSSGVEIDTQFEIAILLDYIKSDQTYDVKNYLESIFRMLSKMIENTK
jgi:four helix bundle protein